MNKLYLLGTFCVGAALGGVMTYIFMKDKVQKKADEQIESVKDAFSDHCKDCYYRLNYTDLDEHETVYEEMKESMTHIVEKYDGLDEVQKKESDSMNDSSGGPYRITEDDFGQFLDYATKYYEYYEGDNIVLDDNGDVLTDVEDTIGYDCLYNFPKDKDVIWVRNDDLGADYEIVKYEDAYKDVYLDSTN